MLPNRRAARRAGCLAVEGALILCVCVALVCGDVSRAAAVARLSTAPTLLYVQQPCTPVYAKPTAQSAQLTALLGGTDVSALEQVKSGSSTWQHVRFWSGIDGYVTADALKATPPQHAEEGACEFPGVPDPSTNILPASHGLWPLTVSGAVSAPTTLYTRPDDTSLPMAGLAIGSVVTTLAWASDAQGHPWYQVRTSAASGWVWSGAVRVNAADPATHEVSGKPIWTPVAGKGMWFTNYLTHHADIATLMHAAKLAGITHIYAEVAISTYGFYAPNSLDRLLPAAHAAGIAVIAWVYPYLKDISADVRMTQQVANYVTPTGDHPDGIATDVEEVDDSASVYTYGQLLRALLGSDTLLVSAVYHPFAQSYYPYAAIAASWNVIAPMDYWHSRAGRQYSAQDVERFVSRSITTIRAALGSLGTNAMLPIEELGQTYDMFTDDGIGGQNSPTGAEITADMQSAHELGCIGVSFFEWQTATQDEWAAVSAFQW
ncbi:MAG: hypothetical protein OJF49_000194 [Ktedonobacterales bacterium]|nr:MAG: hypothetical protein OJF49_000194 [Ktedonobacterales bacterium]